MAMEGSSKASADASNPDEASLLENFEKFTTAGYKCVGEGVAASCLLPEGASYKMFATEDKFRQKMKKTGRAILNLMQMVLGQTNVNGRFGDYSLDEKQDLLVDANDSLLDRAHQNMDVLEGIREVVEIDSTYHKALSGSWNKPPTPSATMAKHQSTPTTPTRGQSSGGSQVPVLHMAKMTTRPQIFFKDKIDNSNSPWVPRIKEKPNSMKPLSILIEVNEEGYESYSHPYEYELDHWSPPAEQLKHIRADRPKNIDSTPFMYVDTPEQLDQMMSELKGEKALAVDLEHHSYRSFMGFTCLLQLSTKSKDYVVDTLTLRDKLHVLNEIFTHPKVVKVFHGAENDIDWLQRDLSVYVVNMFDTYQAAKVLQCPKLNLAYLMKHYCQQDVDKHFQLYDWRTRPLSENALKYAREDTHYLLFIYALMTNQLIKAANGRTNLLEAVYQRSTETCKKKYIKPLLEEDSHMVMYRKGNRLFDNRQLFALKELFTWRDTIARDEDESRSYVLPNHMMLQMADNLPREAQGLLACCNPIPPLVRQYVQELHMIMMKAREQPLVKAIPDQRIVGSGGGSGTDFPTGIAARLFDCEPGDFRDDLPTLIDSSLVSCEDGDDDEGINNVLDIEEGVTEDVETNSGTKVLWKSAPDFPLGAATHETEYSKKIMKSWKNIEDSKLLNAYQRYKLVLPYVNQMERERQDEEEKEVREKEQRRIQAEEERSLLLKGRNTLSLKREEEGEDEPISQKYRKGKRKSDEARSASSVDRSSEAKRQQLSSMQIKKNEEETSLMPPPSRPPPVTANVKRPVAKDEASFISAEVTPSSSKVGREQHNPAVSSSKKRKSSGGGKNSSGKKHISNSPWKQFLENTGAGKSANPYNNINFNKFSMAGQSHLQQQQSQNYLKVADSLRPKRKKKQQFGGKNMNFKKRGGRH